ncbi:MAG: flagellar basal body protein [Ruminococcus sp.]|jgi:flagellar hook-associated protein FlgK|nr:flagellar basal body protein [Ruminococcus sp.]
MPSSFMGLYVQREALLSAQKSLDITGNNLSNVNTKGYTRQRVDMASVGNDKAGISYQAAISMAGRGSEVVGVAQVRDALLDKKFRDYTSNNATSDMKIDIFGQLEDALDNIENETTGFAAVTATLKEALQSYSSDNADRKELGTIVMTNAKSVCNMLRQLNTRISDVSEQTFSEANTAVTDVNNIFAQMAELNKAIKDSYVNMGYISITHSNYQVESQYGPLELKDKFNLLLDTLSEYGNVDVKETEDGTFQVRFGGKLAVSLDQYNQVALRASDAAIAELEASDEYLNATEEEQIAMRDELISNPPPTDMNFVMLDEGTYNANTLKYSGLMDNKQWSEVAFELRNEGFTISDWIAGNTEDTPVTTNITDEELLQSGSMRALLDLYNGKGQFAVDDENTYEGIEYFRSLINNYGKTFADTLNNIFNGVNDPEADFTAQNSPPYMDEEPADPSQMLISYQLKDGTLVDNIAETIAVSDFWQKFPAFISNPQFDVDDNGNMVYDEHTALDNQYINKVLGAFEKGQSYLFETSNYTFEDYISHYGNSLGTRMDYETKIASSSDVMLLSITNARDEVMGTSIDEEGVNMMNYQKWYNAVARMTTTMDDLLDRLINNTGRVGL